MGQHRTKKTRERAAQRRTQEISRLYSLKDVEVTKSPLRKSSVNAPAGKAQAYRAEEKQYFARDMRKTLVVAAVIVILETVIWLRLKQ